MTIYDISRELFSANVYPGDPAPRREQVLAIGQGAPCNLSKLEMGSHSATHMDAPAHFVADGKGADQIALEQCVGECRVVTLKGQIGAGQLEKVLGRGCKRLLIKGEIELLVDGARALVDGGVQLLGVEGFTVGTPATSPQIHRTLLEREIVIVEALDLSEVLDGEYFLFAVPLKMSGVDGSPCRAILVSDIIK